MTPHQYTEAECKKMKRLDRRRVKKCQEKGFNCDYVAPYGFVPEAGSPYHDV